MTGNSRRRCARGADRPKRPEGTEWSGLPCEGFADRGYDFGGERADLSGVVSFGPDDETVHPDGAYERDKVLGPLGGGPLERAGRLRLDDTGDVVDPADRVRIPARRQGCVVDAADSRGQCVESEVGMGGSQPSAFAPVRASMRGPYEPSHSPRPGLGAGPGWTPASA